MREGGERVRELWSEARMSIFMPAHFPISGPIQNPVADDYATEAMRLLELAYKGDARLAANQLLKRKAHEFQRVARRLSWAPASQRTCFGKMETQG